MLNRRALPHSSFYFETVVAVFNFACEIVVKALDEKGYFLWDSKCAEYAPKTFPMDAVEGLLEVYKNYVELSLPLCVLLNDITQCEDLVDASSTLPKTKKHLGCKPRICLDQFCI